jgi:hypothetical protein
MYNESPLAQIRYRAEMKTSAAIQTVSAVMSPIGRQPTANSCLNDVFIPSQRTDGLTVHRKG